MQTKSTASKKAHEIKNAAFAFGVYGNGSKRIAEIAVTNKGLIWSNNGTKSAKDVVIKWDAFIDWMETQLPASAKAKAPAKVPAKAKAASKAKSSANGKAKTTPKARAARANTNGTKRAAPAKKAAVKRTSAAASKAALH